MTHSNHSINIQKQIFLLQT